MSEPTKEYYETAGQAVFAAETKNPRTRAQMPAWIKSMIRRARREGVDSAVNWELRHTSKAQRDAFDQYLVKIGHPSAYETGTQEYRIKRFVRERTRKRGNPSASEIRTKFAGRHRRNSSLYFPDGTPGGLAKLGKLVKPCFTSRRQRGSSPPS